MSLPHFLVIGAMKSGTTTLYKDLETVRGVGLFEKEASPLLRDAARAEYRRGFADGATLRGDVSTHYAMRPQYDGVVERAAALLPAGTRILYIMRDPVARAVSHYRHWSTNYRFDVPADLDEAVETVPELTDWGRYTMQARPWVDAFGPDRVLPIRFEDYVRDRAVGLRSVCDWLGVDAPPQPAAGDAHNRSAEKPVLNGFWTRVRFSPAYVAARRFLPQSLKESAKRAVMKPATEPARLSEAARAELVSRLAPDVAKLPDLFGPAAPTWDWTAGEAARDTPAVVDGSAFASTASSAALPRVA